MSSYNTHDIPRHYIVSIYYDESVRDATLPPHHLVERAIRDELSRPKAKYILIVPATSSNLERFTEKLANERNRKR